MCFDLFSMRQVAEAEKETLKSSLELMEIRLSSMKEILKTQESELSKVDTVQLYCNTVGCGLCVWGGVVFFWGGCFCCCVWGWGVGLSFVFFYTFKAEVASLCLGMAPPIAETELLGQANVTGACGQAEN